MKNHGFIGLWMNMQKTFCGANTPPLNVTSNSSSSSNSTNTTSTAEDNGQQFDSLNISPGQLKSLSLLFQIMYSNPVILFSPNTTVITENLIKKTNATFELIDKINKFSHQWLDTSEKLVDYLRHEQTNKSLSMLNSFKSIALNMTNSTELDYDTNPISTTTKSTPPKQNAKNFTFFKVENASLMNSLRGVSNKTVDDLISQIQMIDSAACSWLSLMSGVNLNVFKGIFT